MELKISGLDIETGGLNPQKNGIISIAVIAPNGKKFYQVISPNPQLAYEESALKINGFILEKYNGKTRWLQNLPDKTPTPVLSLPEPTVIRELISFLRENCKDSYFAGCNIAFDKTFILEAAKRTDKKPFLIDFFSTPQERTEEPLSKEFLHRTYELQTIALYLHQTGINPLPKNKYNTDLPSISLQSIANSVGIEQPKQHHALQDVQITLSTLQALLELTTQTKQKSPRHRETRHHEQESWNKYPKKQPPIQPPIQPRTQPPTQPPIQPHFNNTDKKNKKRQVTDPYPLLEAAFTSPTPLTEIPEIKDFINKNGYIKNTIFKNLSETQKAKIIPLIKKRTQKNPPQNNQQPPSKQT